MLVSNVIKISVLCKTPILLQIIIAAIIAVTEASNTVASIVTQNQAYK